jgi:hypothetical protein
MTLLEKIYLGNSVQTWLIALGAVLVTFLALLISRKIMIRHLSILAERTETQIDDLLLAILSGTKNFFLFIASIYIGSHLLFLQPNVLKIGDKIFFVVVIIQIAIWVGRGINFIISVNVKK